MKVTRDEEELLTSALEIDVLSLAATVDRTTCFRSPVEPSMQSCRTPSHNASQCPETCWNQAVFDRWESSVTRVRRF